MPTKITPQLLEELQREIEAYRRCVDALSDEGVVLSYMDEDAERRLIRRALAAAGLLQ
jgi:hypothetical protein